jgi:hypothetical protein
MTTYKKCPRCSGTGLYGDRGVCFGCNGTGARVADVFLRVVGTSGEFFGITGPVVDGKQFKGIARGNIVNDLCAGFTAKVITEEQARKFYKRYGLRTEIPA